MTFDPAARGPTADRILDAALGLFRRRGFDRTTMRDVASAAGLSLGASYYYFPSKDAIVLAYYVRQIEEHEARVRAHNAGETDVRARLGAVFHDKLDLVRKDRRLLGALFKTVGDPESDLSVFSAATRDVRDRSIAMIDDALAGGGVPEASRALLAPTLWMALLGVLLYFIHDDSPRQERTRRLTDDALDLAIQAVALSSLPAAAPIRARLLEVLARAGLDATPGAAPARRSRRR
jgi:AcrR family transcriptional regulator